MDRGTCVAVLWNPRQTECIHVYNCLRACTTTAVDILAQVRLSMNADAGIATLPSLKRRESVQGGEVGWDADDRRLLHLHVLQYTYLKMASVSQNRA